MVVSVPGPASFGLSVCSKRWCGLSWRWHLCAFWVLALYLLFWLDGSLWLGTTVFTVLVGVLAGMELPLITRLLESQQELRRAWLGFWLLTTSGLW